MKRLLCILSSMDSGGAETFLMKIYRQLDKSKYQMDFCINVPEKCYYEDEITDLGGRIYRIPSKSENRKEFARQLTQLVKSEQYAYILRLTCNGMGLMDVQIAKKAGATRCAVRSTNSRTDAGWKGELLHCLGKMLFGRYVDVKFAPSDLAAIYTFGKKAYDAGEATILHNAVDLGVFRYDPEGREAVRREFDIPGDALLVGHVGRLMTQKNHGYLLQIFSEIQKKRPESKLLLVGKGELEAQLRGQVEQMGLSQAVIFAGVRSDIPQMLSAMDVFVFPSLYEGMPNTVIEAQATGLPCVIADTITREADITGLVQYLPLDKTPGQWAETALAAAAQPRKNTQADFVENKYDIQSVTQQFVQLCFGE